MYVGSVGRLPKHGCVSTRRVFFLTRTSSSLSSLLFLYYSCCSCPCRFDETWRWVCFEAFMKIRNDYLNVFVSIPYEFTYRTVVSLISINHTEKTIVRSLLIIPIFDLKRRPNGARRCANTVPKQEAGVTKRGPSLTEATDRDVVRGPRHAIYIAWVIEGSKTNSWSWLGWSSPGDGVELWGENRNGNVAFDVRKYGKILILRTRPGNEQLCTVYVKFYVDFDVFVDKWCINWIYLYRWRFDKWLGYCRDGHGQVMM